MKGFTDEKNQADPDVPEHLFTGSRVGATIAQNSIMFWLARTRMWRQTRKNGGSILKFSGIP
jgi:hypothetical protein